MKLRCTHNSIRLRFRKSDLKKLIEKNRIEESVQFTPTSSFGFAIELIDNTQLKASITKEHELLISLPIALANSWVNSNQVGIEHHIHIDQEQQLHILLEKDFPCTNRDEEDMDNTYWELAHDKDHTC